MHSTLSELQAIIGDYGRGLGGRKLALLRSLDEVELESASDVTALHELLLLLRAYPDDEAVLEQVDRMLAGFGEREDLRWFSDELADTGIAGTPLHYRFYWDMAAWLARRWPDLLQIDWEVVDRPQAIEDVLPLLVAYSETPALDTMVEEPRVWLERLKGPEETDAAFLIRRFAALRMDPLAREILFESVDVPMRLNPGVDTPSRTRALHRWHPVAFQKRPRRKRRPSLRREAAKNPPVASKKVSAKQGEILIDLAREAMITRHRDLSGIAWADPHDAFLVDAGEGLSFACFGLRPERRLMLEAVHVFVILKNGVPVGYFQSATLFGASELNYNLFPPWRGAEAAAIYARGVAMVHHLLGSDVFAVDPYQLGDGNAEALRTGAFWFYYKLGYRPEDAERKRIVRQERAAMKRDPTHRSTRATLGRLKGEYMFLYLKEPRDDVIGKLHYGEVGAAVSRHLAKRHGADREGALRACSREAMRRVGLATLRDFDENEKLIWERWSPIVALLDGVEDWSTRDKRALVDVIRAKAGRSERSYVRRFNRHRRLREALALLATVRTG